MDYSETEITELAAIVAEHLVRRGIEVVLVGGLAVEFYTENLYLTKDIDMVNTNYEKRKRLDEALAELGFYKRGRIYVNDTTDISLEFPSGPVAVGDSLITETDTAQIGGRQISILKVEDVVKDRLAAFIHWQDKQSLVQALAIILKNQLTPITFQTYCIQEKAKSEYQLLEKLFIKSQTRKVDSMEQLETLLSQLLLEDI